jgi:predicted GIY-YIG superfamily endonuclease
MDEGFRQYLETLHASLERLVAMKPKSVDALPRTLPLACVYLFSEGGRHLYVGRTRNLRQRLRNHCGNASEHNQAAFAFKLAREFTGRTRVDYSKQNSRKELLAVPSFAAAFSNAKIRIRRMELRFIEEKDPLRQALLEIYASFVLKTAHNDFDTH